jgi:hypothetical protein
MRIWFCCLRGVLSAEFSCVTAARGAPVEMTRSAADALDAGDETRATRQSYESDQAKMADGAHDDYKIFGLVVGLGGSEMRIVSRFLFGSSSPPVPATAARPGGLRGGGMPAFGCGFCFMTFEAA